MNPLVLGVDPGLQRTGYALLVRHEGRGRLIEGGVLRTRTADPLPQRLREIATRLREVIADHQPGLLAVEQAIAHGRNHRSSLLVAQVRGAVLLVAAEANLPVIDIAPTKVKLTLTGSGRAAKRQVQAAIQNELNLPAMLEPHDVADASAVALTVLHQVRFAA